MLFALLVERWCLIKGFRIPGPVCGVSICAQWALTKEAKLWFHLSCLSKGAVEQTVEVKMSRKLMTLRLFSCYVIHHSVIDDITGPVRRKTTGHQWFPVARDHWSGALVVQCTAIPSHKMSAWCFLSSLPERSVKQTASLPVSLNPMTRMRCHCYVSIDNSIFRMVEHQDYYVAIIWKSYQTYQSTNILCIRYQINKPTQYAQKITSNGKYYHN